MASPQHPLIYLLPARPWLYKLGVAGLASVTDDALDAVCKDVDIVWLQGAWEVGPFGRLHDLAEPGRRAHFTECLKGDFVEADCIGSPYAITRYVPSKELGSNDDLAAFRKRLADRGVRLMLDFVPNHSARDSPWLKEKPAIYMPRPAGSEEPVHGRDPYSGDWTDTAQLNYWADACREHMLAELVSVAERSDGVRVDMAMLCCNDVVERAWGSILGKAGIQRPAEEFWPKTLQKVRAVNPSFFVLAECYEYEQIYPSGTGRLLLEQGFDAVYDKVFYDRLTEGHMDNIRGHLQGADAKFIVAGNMCHFVENHDEERSAAHFKHRTVAATVASLTMPGPRMMMWGQEFGFQERLAVHLRRAKEENRWAEVADLHTHLLGALPQCRGEWKLLKASGEGAWRLLSWSWTSTSDSGQSIAVVVVNFTDGEAWAQLDLSHLPWPGSEHVKLQDRLSDEVFERKTAELRGSTGLQVGLRGFRSHLLTWKS